MSTSSPSLIRSYQPASFLERGVAVPFTSPQLAGARIRSAERTGTEFVVPNPAGGRGVYILHWGGVRQFCRPTAHDTLLHQRVARLPGMDPRGVRLAARRLAADGLAGREAAAAAAAAIEADQKEQVLVNFLLLVTLMEQWEPAGLRVSAGTKRTPELDQRASRIIGQFGAAVGRGVAEVSRDLETLSGLYVATGLDAEAAPARLPRLTVRLEAAADSLTLWATRYPDDDSAVLAASLARSAVQAVAYSTTALRAARALTGDMRGLLEAWARAPDEVASQVSRPEWVLDGWERFCLLWETAGHVSGQRAIMREMAQLVPALPKETSDWGDEWIEPEKTEPVLGRTPLNDAWRGGAASHGLIARNERLQALIA